MSRVEEIEQAIDSLSVEEFRSIARWVREREQARWDAQMDTDSISGKLEALFQEADDEGREGLLRDWPSTR